MEPRVNYITVGAFVIVLFIALILSIYWLTTKNHKNYEYYLVYMNESVSGLNVNSAVKFNGVDVGFVKDISLNPNNPEQVQLLLAIDENAPVNQSTVATLLMQGVTGITNIGLKATAVTAPALIPPPGSPYPVIRSEPSLLLELDTAVREITHSFKKIGKTLRQVFTPENQKAIHDILHNVAAASENLQTTVENINKAANKLSNFSDHATTTFNSGNSVMQSISRQTLPTINQAADRLLNLILNLDQFATELQANPSMLIRGKQEQPLGPGE